MAVLTRSTPQGEGGEGASVIHEWDASYPLEFSIITLISRITETTPDAIPPLYDSIDVEAIETLLADREPDPRDVVSVTFTHYDCRITINSSGELLVDNY